MQQDYSLESFLHWVMRAGMSGLEFFFFQFCIMISFSSSFQWRAGDLESDDAKSTRLHCQRAIHFHFFKFFLFPWKRKKQEPFCIVQRLSDAKKSRPHWLSPSGRCCSMWLIKTKSVTCILLRTNESIHKQNWFTMTILLHCKVLPGNFRWFHSCGRYFDANLHLNNGLKNMTWPPNSPDPN